MLVFVAVAEAGSFTGAARKLGLRKSTVSRRLDALEERLGVKLLHRTTRQLRMTEAGERYHTRCSHVVAEARAAEEEVREQRGEPWGTLRLSASPPLADQLLPAVLFPYLKSHPGMSVEVLTSWTALDLMAHGIDLALRVGPLSDSSMNARALGAARVAYCASPDYVRAHGAPRAPHELDRHACVGISDTGERVLWPFLGPSGKTVRVPVALRLRVNDYMLAYRAVLAGLGLGRFPYPMVSRDLAAGRLTEVLSEHLPPSFPVYAVYPGSRRAPAKVQAFLQVLTAILKENPDTLLGPSAEGKPPDAAPHRRPRGGPAP
jgi:DNA-binding transcriptional LysR family regulator